MQSLLPIITLVIGSAISIITFYAKSKADYNTLIASQEFALRKEYFIKKLNTFEKATSYYSVAHQSITTMSMMLRTLLKAGVDFDPEIFKNMLESVQRNLMEVYKLTQDAALALPLYTGMEINDEDERLAEEYTTLLGEITSHSDIIIYLNTLISSPDPGVELNNVNLIIGNERTQLVEKIFKLSDVSTQLKGKNQALIASLRLQLKTFIEIDTIPAVKKNRLLFWKK